MLWELWWLEQMEYWQSQELLCYDVKLGGFCWWHFKIERKQTNIFIGRTQFNVVVLLGKELWLMFNGCHHNLQLDDGKKAVAHETIRRYLTFLFNVWVWLIHDHDAFIHSNGIKTNTHAHTHQHTQPEPAITWMMLMANLWSVFSIRYISGQRN